MTQLTPLETAALAKLVSGSHPVLATLRAQLASVVAASRDRTGAGFFVELSVTGPEERVTPDRFTISDVQAELGGLAHGAGFVLWIQDGLLATLEGYTYDEPWPVDESIVRVFYDDPDRARLNQTLGAVA